ncbi:MAG: fructose-bisphosphate aldolase [Bacilli bacterium]|nr:fructose-bisphosphate aldolase [Bacilli bacterium]
MNKEEILKRKGIIVALDQSSGSSEKALIVYGIDKSRYKNKKEMSDLIHKMRKRIITNKYFTKDKIIGVISFDEELDRKIEGEYTSEYLLNKNIISFVKIDNGLEKVNDGVALMKEIPNIEELLLKAKKHDVYGTKMRSVIYENNKKGIRKLVKQQFELAKKIYEFGLVPIVEPEVNIYSKEKKECEKTLKEEIDRQLIKNDIKIILKLSIPEIDNLYEEYTNNKNILKVVALSGGYDRRTACDKLSKNKKMIASFSKAFLQDLRETDSEEIFSEKIKNTIDEIYNAGEK